MVTLSTASYFSLFTLKSKGPIDFVEVSEDNQMILSAADNVLGMWDIHSSQDPLPSQPSQWQLGEEAVELVEYGMWVSALLFNEEVVVTASNDGMLFLVDFGASPEETEELANPSRRSRFSSFLSRFQTRARRASHS